MKASIDTSLCWYVAWTAAQAEEKAARNVRQAGFDAYLPRQRVEKWNKRRNVFHEAHRPLLPRYLFVGLPSDRRHFGFVTAIDGVERLLSIGGEPLSVLGSVVEAIFLAETAMAYDDTRAARKARQEAMDMAFPIGSMVRLRKALDVLRMDGRVIGSNHRDKLQVAFGPLTSWVGRDDVEAA